MYIILCYFLSGKEFVMRILKTSLAFILSIIFLSSMCICSVNALQFSDGTFFYEINASTKTATIVKCSSSTAELTIPNNIEGYKVVAIDADAFAGNSTLEVINFSDNMIAVGDYAFENCTSLKEVIIPSTITNFGINVFSGCTSLETATVNMNIDRLPQGIFYNCSSLKTVNLNSSITEYGNSAFYGCSSLTYAPSINNITELGQRTFQDSALTEVFIPNTIFEIPRNTFANCSELTTVFIPDSVTTISTSAFKNSEKVNIYCYENSAAHSYAKQNAINFTLLSFADVNMDAKANIKDATSIQKYACGLLHLDNLSLAIADVNEDGKVNVTDATTIQKYLIGT